MRGTFVSSAAALAACSAAIGQPIVWEMGAGGNGNSYEAVSVPEGVTWTEAAALAQGLGGHLVTFTSQAESDFVFQNIASDPALWRATGAGSDHAGPWIGLFQDETAPGFSEPGGGWRWVTDEPLSFINWRSAEPNNAFGIESFASLFSGTSTPAATWNDYPDDDPRFGPPISFIVEYPVPAPATAGAFGAISLFIARRRR